MNTFLRGKNISPFLNYNNFLNIFHYLIIIIIIIKMKDLETKRRINHILIQNYIN